MKNANEKKSRKKPRTDAQPVDITVQGQKAVRNPRIPQHLLEEMDPAERMKRGSDLPSPVINMSAINTQEERDGHEEFTHHIASE